MLGPLNGPLRHSRGPQKGPFWPRKALLGAPEGLGVLWWACFWPNCHCLVQLGVPHPYHVLGPLQRPLLNSWGPQKRPVLGQKGPFGGPGGPWAAPRGLIWAQLPLADPSGRAVSISCAPASSKTSTALLGPPKGHRFGQKIPFGGPWGSPDIPYNPNGVPISQMPPIHQLPAVWNVICAYRDILGLHFSRKGPKRAFLP